MTLRPYRRQMLIAATVLSLFASCSKELEESVEPIENTETTSATTTASRQFTLVPDANGRLIIDNKSGAYQPGDVLNLKGAFKAIYISNMSGKQTAPIVIQNLPGTNVTVGNPSWNGGSYAQALAFSNCHYIRVGGSSKTAFVINGSTQSYREAYFNIHLTNKSDNFEICRMTVNNGGTGIVAKTEPVKGDASTAFPNYTMNNLSIHDLTITGTKNEGMYIGHTATYWDLTSGAPYYGVASGFASGHSYVQPIKWNNVKIYTNLVQNTGLDGIQTAAINKLEVYNNVVTNWATQKNSGHNGGILIGGRTTNTNTHDNWVHDGWGELCQFYGSGEGGATHIFKNNLFVANEGDGVSMRGYDNAIVQFVNNTIVKTKGNSLRINGYTGQTGKNIVSANAFIAPMGGGTVYAKNYIYVENGAQVTEGTGTLANAKIATISAAGVNASYYYQPLTPTLLAAAGFRK
jgi:hypothetical protein